ncbi:apolipoprotein N-acyltransferase [Helicobacter sp. 13S00482-2]|nr:apolipoprotein N-acyltransferase [Helicobacter sp. 13S00482-2]
MKIRILSALVLAVIFLIPVYGGGFFAYLGFEKTALVFQTFFGLLSVQIFLSTPKTLKFWFGFFVGLGLFYWTGLSFRFSPMEFLIPFVMIFVSIIYGLVFYFLFFYNSCFWRIFTLMVSSYIHPFGFDWFVIESFFSYSAFGVDKLRFFGIIVGILMLVSLRKYWKFVGVCFLLLCVDWGYVAKNTQSQSNLSINAPYYEGKLNLEIITTSVSQSQKWDEKQMKFIIDNNFNLIRNAQQEYKDVVVLPETAFPFILNRSFILDELMILGRDITIIAGGLREDENHRIYNSIYIFQNGDFKYIDKVVLAPFGEKIPLPEFLAKPLRKLFFGQDIGLSDAKKLGNIQIGKDVFRGAICYEGTSGIMYQDRPRYMIVISNNAWFVPSIEPILQRMLIKYYARVYGSVVIHSSNHSLSYVVSDSVLGDKNL